jgi:hypothetical protein
MDAFKILAELRNERDQIEETISSLERPSRRGRAPAWLRRGRTTKPPGSPRGGGDSSGGSGPATPAYPRPRLEDMPTRGRRTPPNPELKSRRP